MQSLKGKGPKEAFFLGLGGGTVAFLGSVYWVVVAVNRYGSIPLPLALPILLLLSLYLGSYWAIFALGLTRLPQGVVRFTLGMASLWVLLEYVRGKLLSGFPWALLAHSQWRALPLLQICDLTGAWGLSFLLASVNGVLWTLLSRPRCWRRATACGLLPLLSALLYGAVKLKEPLPPPAIRVGIVQGNIRQDLKWKEAYRRETLTIHRELTLKLAKASPQMVIWPETAFPESFPKGELSEEVRETAREARSYLLFGAVREEGGRYYNSAFLLSPEGEVLGHYDKLHLVPFGEFIPLREYLEPLFGQLASLGDLTPGQQMALFRLPQGDFAVLICFEVIFPELSRLALGRGADFLVTITNDAWFGCTSAPYQHMAQVIFRAVEGRTWFARAANTGISGIVDPRGRVVRKTEIFTRGAFTGLVGKTEGPTPYQRMGDWFVLLSAGMFTASVALQGPDRDRPSCT